ncbi:MAG: 16S rRNA (guanine(527)-N(7))-methyltransferase RsmG [Candidatus Eisenbacteria bacterium]|nr:16S rRNA (guanine(527)-N(7))-methyltransferase RsmG [Candidatus Eisenbacteria bacterium]
MAELAREAMEALAGPVPDDRFELLRHFGRVLEGSARRFGLVSKRDERLIGTHILDSASLLSLGGVDEQLSQGELADLGTGGGLPGMVLAILRPRITVALVDSRRSRVVFLKQAIDELELKNVRIVHERIEHIVSEESFANATARALGTIDDVLVMSLGALRPGGRLFLYKGPAWARERARAVRIARGAGAELEREEQVRLPGLGRATTFAVFHVKQV